VTEVHTLAGELGVSSAVIRQTVTEITGNGTDSYSLDPALADQVRAKLRSLQRNVQGSTGSPMFSGPVVGTAAVRPANRAVGPVFAGTPEQRPAQGPRSGEGFSTTPGASKAPESSDYAASLASQLAEQTATAADNEQWRAAGLGAHVGHLIDLCQRHGLVPADLRRRVDGQTVASRLKNGESMSSVRSRMS
jgi:hypothetical protein